MRRRIWALGVAVAIVVASGCSSGGQRTDPSTTTSTTASAAPNPDVIPPVITPAYVDAVFKVLNHIYGDATRELLSANSVDSAVRTDLRAIFNDPLYQQEIEDAATTLKSGSKGLHNPVGDVTTTVKSVISASQLCIFVETQSNFSAVNVHPERAASEYWGLEPKAPGNDPTMQNPTPWALWFNADYLSPTSIPDQCVGR